MRSFVNSSEILNVWGETGSRLLRERLETWTTSGENVAIFAEFSTMVMTVVIYAIMGAHFTEKYAKELVPLVQAYEMALQDPLAKGLRLWASNPGRLIKSVERFIKRVINEEVKERLENPEKYKKNVDFFQQLSALRGNTQWYCTDPRLRSFNSRVIKCRS